MPAHLVEVLDRLSPRSYNSASSLTLYRLILDIELARLLFLSVEPVLRLNQSLAPSLVVIVKEVNFVLIEPDFLALADFIQDHLANDVILFISELVHQIIEPLKVFVS